MGKHRPFKLGDRVMLRDGTGSGTVIDLVDAMIGVELDGKLYPSLFAPDILVLESEPGHAPVQEQKWSHNKENDNHFKLGDKVALKDGSGSGIVVDFVNSLVGVKLDPNDYPPLFDPHRLVLESRPAAEPTFTGTLTPAPTGTLELTQRNLLAINDETPAEQVISIIGQIDSAMARAKALKADLEALLLEWIPANGGELVIGDVRYYVGPKKKENCTDVPAATTAILEATGGDEDKFCNCLSANPFKYGEVKKVLGDKYGQYFQTTTELDLKTSKPLKKVHSVNTKFLK